MNWILPANSKKYDHERSFNDHGFIDWRQNDLKTQAGDLIFIYCSAPLMRIQYKCQVEIVNMKHAEIRDDKDYWTDMKEYQQSINGKFMRLRLIEKSDSDKLKLDNLLKHDLKSPPYSGRKLRQSTFDYIEQFFQEPVEDVESIDPDYIPLTNEESQLLLAQFLERWPLEKVKKLKLDEYVGVGDKDTFCQWVETKTRRLGSIKGLPSIKFGIYKRKDPTKEPKNYKNDKEYSWLKDYDGSRQEVFKKVLNYIIATIELSQSGKFNLIDKVNLPDLFKWKVAFLYSNERLIPIYKRDVLLKIAEHFGMKASDDFEISKVQELMIAHKPAELSAYEFMRELYYKFEDGSTSNYTAKKKPKQKTNSQRHSGRKAASGKNVQSHMRSGSQSTIVNQIHNKIQTKLEQLLIEEYGKDSVKIEEDYVDIKVTQPNLITLYEVKSSAYASGCIREALGQILLYSLNDTDTRPKHHIVVGQYPPNESDKKFIQFVKENLRLEFDYQHLSLD